MFNSSNARVSTIVPAASGARRSRGMGPAAADRGLVAATGGTGADAAARAAGAAAADRNGRRRAPAGDRGCGRHGRRSGHGRRRDHRRWIGRRRWWCGRGWSGRGRRTGGGRPSRPDRWLQEPQSPRQPRALPPARPLPWVSGPQPPLPRCPHPPPPRPPPVWAPPQQGRRTRRRSDRRPRPPPSTSDRRRPRRPGNGTARPWARWSPCPPVDRIAGRLLPVVPRRQVSRAPPRRPYAAVSHGLALVERRIARGRGHPDRPGGSLRS